MFMHRQNGYFEGNEFFTYAKKNTSCICKMYKVFALQKIYLFTCTDKVILLFKFRNLCT